MLTHSQVNISVFLPADLMRVQSLRSPEGMDSPLCFVMDWQMDRFYFPVFSDDNHWHLQHHTCAEDWGEQEKARGQDKHSAA